MFLPEQEVPFPVYPVLQAHVKDPSVFVQAALASQLWVLREHSSLSKEAKTKYKHSFRHPCFLINSLRKELFSLLFKSIHLQNVREERCK